MSVSWQDDSSPARLKAVEAANVSGEFDPDVPTWSIYADLREALIWALLSTGFPPRSEWAITESNWKQLYVRLQILETTRGCFRIYNNGGLASREVWFTPAEVKSMIGLSVNAGNKSDAEFRKQIFRLLDEDATGKLNRFIDPPKKMQDDPYYWEKLHDPSRGAA